MELFVSLLDGGSCNDGLVVSGLDNEVGSERCFEFELEFGFKERGFVVESELFGDFEDFEDNRRGRVGSQVRFVTFLTTSSVVSSGGLDIG